MSKKTRKRKVAQGIAYIQATFNNTLITVTDQNGKALAQESAGSCGFKGSRKGTPYPAQLAVEKLVQKLRDNNDMKSLEIYVKGPGAGREAAIRAFHAHKMAILKITDATPIPHNGVRQRKKRRV